MRSHPKQKATKPTLNVEKNKTGIKHKKKHCWSLCEIMDQAGAGFHKPEQQQRLLFPVEVGQDDYIKEMCSTEGLIFNPARL